MPILKSPEVLIDITSSGHAGFHQQIETDLPPQETDVGVNAPTGNNVVCWQARVSHSPNPGDKASGIRLSVFLSEEWLQKDDFIAALQAQNVNVREEDMAWGSTLTKIVATGQNDIHIFARALRESFAETAHQGATIARQIIHPALLGEALDYMNAEVSKSREQRNSLGNEWATYGWTS